MSVEALAWAKRCKTGSSSAKLVLMVLADYADEKGRCWPSQQTISEQAELSKRSVLDQLKVLQAGGFIRRVERIREDGSRASDVIYLCFGGGEAPSPPGAGFSGGGERPSLGVVNVVQGGGEPASPLTTFEPPLEPSIEPSLSTAEQPTEGEGGRKYPEAFEAAWKAYPHIKGRSSKPKSLGYWRRIPAEVRERLLPAIERYGREGREPRQDCGAPAFERWLRDERYAEWLSDAASPSVSPFAWPVERWAVVVERWRMTGGWPEDYGPPPDHPTTLVPLNLRPPSHRTAA